MELWASSEVPFSVPRIINKRAEARNDSKRSPLEDVGT